MRTVSMRTEPGCVHHARVVKSAHRRVVTDHDARARVPHHQVEPVARIGRIEGHIGSTCHHDAEQRCDRLRRAPHTDANRFADLDPKLDQPGGDRPGSFIEL